MVHGLWDAVLALEVHPGGEVHEALLQREQQHHSLSSTHTLDYMKWTQYPNHCTIQADCRPHEQQAKTDTTK